MQRPDPMIAAKPGAEDVQAMAARTLWLEELYFLDGRDQVSHPHLAREAIRANCVDEKRQEGCHA